MAEVFVDMLPLIIGAMLLPVYVIIVLMLLSGENGLAKGIAFVSGITLTRVLQGIIFGFMLTGRNDSAAGASPNRILPTLLLVLGILLLITAYKKWAKEPDPDAPPPTYLDSLAGMSTPKTLAMGALLVAVGAKLWVFTLGAINTIGAANLGRGSSIVAYLLYVIAAQLLIILPVIAYAIAPAWAGKTLGNVRMWLDQHNRVIMIVVSLVFGLLFLWQGIAGLVR